MSGGVHLCGFMCLMKHFFYRAMRVCFVPLTMAVSASMLMLIDFFVPLARSHSAAWLKAASVMTSRRTRTRVGRATVSSSSTRSTSSSFTLCHQRWVTRCHPYRFYPLKSCQLFRVCTFLSAWWMPVFSLVVIVRCLPLYCRGPRSNRIPTPPLLSHVDTLSRACTRRRYL